MLKWLFARNDVIIEKAMAHILRTGQAFDLRFFCSLLNREYCRNILLPENRFWPFQLSCTICLSIMQPVIQRLVKCQVKKFDGWKV